MKHKTAELEGALLDAAVAQAEGDDWSWPPPYSTQWERGGPIIEREGICLQSPDTSLFPPEPNPWHAGIPSQERPVAMFDCKGPTPLVAAMRAYVASKFGEEVELP